MKSLHLFGTLLALVLAPSFSAKAVPIPVPNHSFEQPAQADGSWTIGDTGNATAVPSWTISAAPGHDYFKAGVQNSTSIWYPGTTGSPGLLPSPADGLQFGYLNTPGGFGSSLTSGNLAAVVPSATYTLTVAVGRRIDVNSGRYTLRILAGGATVASTEFSGLSLTAGSFRDVTLSWQAPATASGNLAVRLIHTGFDTDSALQQGNFDNVRLDVVYESDSLVVADSVEDFSGTQGEKGWSYGYFDGPFVSGDFTPMARYDAASRSWTIDASSYWTEISATAAHPNGANANGRTSKEHWAVRRWTSTVAGKLIVSGQFAHLAPSGLGNGAVIRIFVDGTEVYTRTIENNDTVARPYRLAVNVQVGSTVDFALDPRNANDGADSTLFTSVIRKPDPAMIADSVADFSGVQGQENWEYGYSTGAVTESSPYSLFRFIPMGHHVATSGTHLFGNAWQATPLSFWTFINAEGTHPNGTITSAERTRVEHWTIRRWTSPIAGRLRFSGTLAHAAPSGLGNGVIARIHRNGTEVFTRIVSPTDVAGVPWQISMRVEIGDKIDFVVDPRNGDDRADSTIYTASIIRDSADLLADSVADFSSTQGWNGWSYGWNSVSSLNGLANYNFAPMTQFLEETDTELTGNAWYSSKYSAYTYLAILSAEGAHSHAGILNSGIPIDDRWAVRRWQSDFTGPVRISGTLKRLAPAGLGNGVVARIVVDGTERHSRTIENTDTTRQTYEFDLDLISGSRVDLTLDPRNSDMASDATEFTAVIRRRDGGTTGSSIPGLTIEPPTGNPLSNGGFVNLGTSPVRVQGGGSFTFQNLGATLLVLSISLDGEHAADFALGTFTASVPPGATLELPVSFAPQEPGIRQAVLTVTSADPTHPPFVLNLSGTGVPSYPVTAVAENGTVTGTGTFPAGSNVVLTVAPDPGYVFSHWSGDAAGTANPLALTVDGAKEVVAHFTPASPPDAIGWNYVGSLNYGSSFQPPVPDEIAIPMTGIRAISAGPHHAAVLKRDGGVIAWGGMSRYASPHSPEQVPLAARSGVTAIAVGGVHIVALKEGGGVIVWGTDAYGLMTIPPEARSGVIAISAGSEHAVALRQDGRVVAWGRGDFRATVVPQEAESGVSAIAAGNDGMHNLALKQDGSVIAWGYDYYGQATVPDEAQSDVVAVAAGSAHNVVLKQNGSVIAWGYNWFGQTEVPVEAQSGVIAVAAGSVHTLALKQDGSVIAWGANDYGQTTVPEAARSGVIAIAAGERHTMALKQDGSIVAWGEPRISAVPPAALVSSVQAVASGSAHTLALKQDGGVVAWGDNGEGQTTVPDEAQSDIVAIAAYGNNSVALKQDGTVVSWGQAVGLPIEAQSEISAIAVGSRVPVVLKRDGSVLDFSNDPASIPEGVRSGVTSIAAGEYHVVALKNGSVFAWGNNDDGQATVPPEAQSGVVAIAAGWRHTVALKQDGGVVAWGNNLFGQTTVPEAARSGVIAIAVGAGHTVALKHDGSVVTFGRGFENFQDHQDWGGYLEIPPQHQGRVTAISAGWNATFYHLAGSIPDHTQLFQLWADAASLSGADALPSATPHHDGVANLLKYAFNLNAAGPDVSRLVPASGLAGLPFFEVKESESGPVFHVEYLRRKNVGLTYTPKVSPDLAPDSFVPMIGLETVTPIDAGWERVSLAQPIAPQTTPRLFGVVEVGLGE
jgi:alpha-tubulin suppressor-like RCC1 family protein